MRTSRPMSDTPGTSRPASEVTLRDSRRDAGLLRRKAAREALPDALHGVRRGQRALRAVDLPAGMTEPLDAEKLIEEMKGVRAYEDDKVLYLTSRKLKERDLAGGKAPTTGFAQYGKGRASSPPTATRTWRRLQAGGAATRCTRLATSGSCTTAWIRAAPCTRPGRPRSPRVSPPSAPSAATRASRRSALPSPRDASRALPLVELGGLVLVALACLVFQLRLPGRLALRGR